MLGLVVETVEAYLHTAMAPVPQAPITGRQTGRRALRRDAELRQWKVWL